MHSRNSAQGLQPHNALGWSRSGSPQLLHRTTLTYFVMQLMHRWSSPSQTILITQNFEQHQQEVCTAADTSITDGRIKLMADELVFG